jgi:phosphoglycolate phosphatase
MIYDAVIFDIDGTLWNATSANAKGWNLGLEELGMPQRVTPAQIESVSGNPYELCLDMLLPGERTNHPELLQIFITHETRVVAADGGVFYDGALSGVIQLSQDYRIFLISNCPDWYLSLFLKFSQLRPVLSDVDCFGMSHVPKDKMIRNMVRGHCLKNPVYVGDTANDETAAALAGVDFIHVAWGFGRPERDSKSVHSFAKLLEVLRETKASL